MGNTKKVEFWRKAAACTLAFVAPFSLVSSVAFAGPEAVEPASEAADVVVPADHSTEANVTDTKFSVAATEITTIDQASEKVADEKTKTSEASAAEAVVNTGPVKPAVIPAAANAASETATIVPQAESVLVPAAAGDTFTATINVGGVDIPCVYTVLTDNGGGTGTVAIGNGANPAIDKAASGALVIPATVSDGVSTYTVTQLNNNCFYSCVFLTDTGLDANSTVALLGDGCFAWCISLVDTGLGTNRTVTELGNACFWSCDSLTETGLSTNNTLTSLGKNCFAWCTSLTGTGLSTNSTIKEIGDSWLTWSGVKDVAVGSGVNKIGAFLASTFDPAASVCFYGSIPDYDQDVYEFGFAVPSPVYYLSENEGWSDLSAEDFTNCSGLLALSTLSAENGTIDSAPGNVWAGKTGTASEGRWAQGETAQISCSDPNFDHWEIVADGAADPGTLADATAASTSYTMGSENTVLRAVLKQVSQTYTVTYVHHGDVVYETAEVEDGATATAPAENPAYGTNEFRGWCTDAAGTQLYDFATPVTGELVLFARWGEAPKVYVVAYQVSGDVPAGYAAPSDSAEYKTSDRAIVEDPPEEGIYPGYSFTGWTLNGEEVTTATIVDGNLVFEGVWKKEGAEAPVDDGNADNGNTTPNINTNTGNNGTTGGTTVSGDSAAKTTTTAAALKGKGSPATGDPLCDAVVFGLLGTSLLSAGATVVARRRRADNQE